MLGGLTDDGLASDDVHTWDLRNDMVTRRNPMPKHVTGTKFVVQCDKIYGISGCTTGITIDDRYLQANYDTLCYSINEDSWIILPQGRFEDQSY